MKILFLTSRVPFPLNKGDKLRAYHFIKELSVYHEIVLCCVNDEKYDDNVEIELKKFVKKLFIFNIGRLSILYKLFINLFKRKPFQVAYFTHSHIQDSINKIVEFEKPNLIFYQLLRMAEYAQQSKIPKMLDYMDVLSAGIEKRIEHEHIFKKLIFRIEYKRVLNYEHDIFKRFEKHCIITQQDRNLIPHSERDKIKIVSNGVDLNYFVPPNQKYEKNYDIIFSGNMAYPPNITSAIYLVKIIIPLVKIKFPKITVVIVGTSPSKEVLALASENVIITGQVEDIRTYFYESKIFVGPLFMNTGLQNKLLEAMAMKTPCITSQLANNALEAIPTKQIEIANNPQEFAYVIEYLLTHTAKADFIANNAYDFIQNNHNWKAVVKVLNNAIVEIV